MEEKNKEKTKNLDIIDEEKKNIKNDLENNSSSKKKIIIIILSFIALILICVIVTVIFSKKNKNNIDNEIVIERPVDAEIGIYNKKILSLACKDKNEDNVYSLEKNSEIFCNLSLNIYNSLITELYFDVSNSNNIELTNYEQNNNYKIEKYKNTFKISFDEGVKSLEDGLTLKFKVNDSNKKTGYIDISDILFKDDKKNYYKITDLLYNLPEVKEDKIYFYEINNDDEISYNFFKAKIEDIEFEDGEELSNASLKQTYYCKDENCKVIYEIHEYFLISDESLYIYNVKTNKSEKIKSSDDIDIDNYDFELILLNNKLLGIAFYDEDENDVFNSYGYTGGYYSLNEKSFTIPLNEDYIIKSISKNTDEINDIGLLVKNNNKFGFYSYQKDQFTIEMTSEYENMSFNYDYEVIELKTNDSINNSYHYTLYDPVKDSFKINTNGLDCSDNKSVCLYDTQDDENNNIFELLNANGTMYKELPYYRSQELVMYDNSKNIKAVKRNNIYTVFDENYIILFKTKYELNKILFNNYSYLVVNKDNELYIENGRDASDIIKVCDLDDNNIYSSSNYIDSALEIYIYSKELDEKEDNNNNGYKYTFKNNELMHEETFIEYSLEE